MTPIKRQHQDQGMKGHIHHFATEAKWDQLQSKPILLHKNTADPLSYLLMWFQFNGSVLHMCIGICPLFGNVQKQFLYINYLMVDATKNFPLEGVTVSLIYLHSVYMHKNALVPLDSITMQIRKTVLCPEGCAKGWMDRQKDYQRVPEHNVVLHRDNLLTVFQQSHQFDMLFHLLQRQPDE